MRVLLVVLVCLLPSLGQAQYWATREVCDAQEARLHPELFEPLSLAQARQRAADIPNGVDLFWRITAPSGGVSHLYGTYHVSDPRVLDLPELVLTQIEAAREVWIEVDPIAPSRRQLEIRGDWSKRFRDRSADFRFSELGLPKELSLWVGSRLHALGFSAQVKDHLTFSALNELLLSSPCNDFMSSLHPILDHYIATRARIAGVPVHGLEEFNDFRKFLDDPANEDIAIAGIAVSGAHMMPQKDNWGQETGLALYRSGQIGLWMVQESNFLQTLYGEEAADRHLQLWDGYLLEHRNRVFLDTALGSLSEGGAFLAVGGFHLPGRQGMVAMLRQEGFEVTRVPLPLEAAE